MAANTARLPVKQQKVCQCSAKSLDSCADETEEFSLVAAPVIPPVQQTAIITPQLVYPVCAVWLFGTQQLAVAANLLYTKPLDRAVGFRKCCALR